VQFSSKVVAYLSLDWIIQLDLPSFAWHTHLIFALLGIQVILETYSTPPLKFNLSFGFLSNKL